VVSSNRELNDVEQTGAARRTFDLSGGALCLDYANTLDDRPDPRPNEYLESYADLLAFARQTGALAESDVARLHDASARRSAEAAAVLARAIELRETIYRLFLAVAGDDPVPTADLASLNVVLAEALSHARVAETPTRPRLAEAPAQPRFTWTWADDPLSLDLPLWPVARSAAELLTSPDLQALRLCASDRCDWLFLDTSRNGSRRWCSMRTCGNRAKARRHHARVRAAGATAPAEA
jgi:predicted RNA-binding Zn ribbon-like protein